MSLAKSFFPLALVFLLLSSPTLATTIQEHTMTTSHSTLTIPTTHTQTLQKTVQVDGETAVLTRYSRADSRNSELGGEHFSTVIAADGTLKGFSNMSLDLVGQPLPSREKSEQIARAFLQEHAPDLLERMEISWIDPHDEPLTVEQNGITQNLTLTGMKVKFVTR